MPEQRKTESPQYSIGACARMTGLSRHSLRKWEDRYGAVTPARTEGGTRRYTTADVTRLRLMRELVDSGHAVGAIAGLTVAELREMAGMEETGPATGGTLRVVVVGETVPEELSVHAANMPAIALVASAGSVEEVDAIDGDVVVVEMPSLDGSSAQRIERLRMTTGISRVVVVYAFGPLSMVERLSDARTAMVRQPLVYAELERVVRSLSWEGSGARARDSDIPPHRVGRDELARLSRVASALECECPRHTSELVLMLSRFEDYSRECERQAPEDAVIHRRLERHAALARSVMEEALIELARAEGIALTMLPRETRSP